MKEKKSKIYIEKEIESDREFKILIFRCIKYMIRKNCYSLFARNENIKFKINIDMES